nr:hypothetical protein [Pirellula staleyi]
MLWRPRISLLSLLLLTTLACVGLAWWIDRTREPEPVYLHLYKTYARESCYIAKYKKLPIAHVATVRFISGQPFMLASPNNYEPTFKIAGKLSPNWDGSFSGKVMYDIFNSLTAYTAEGPPTMELDTLYSIFPKNEEAIAISRSEDPYHLVAEPYALEILRKLERQHDGFGDKPISLREVK